MALAILTALATSTVRKQLSPGKYWVTSDCPDRQKDSAFVNVDATSRMTMVDDTEESTGVLGFPDSQIFAHPSNGDQSITGESRYCKAVVLDTNVIEVMFACFNQTSQQMECTIHMKKS